MPNAQVRLEGDIPIVAVHGRFDFAKVALLRDGIKERMNAPEPRLFLMDMSRVTTVDSSAMGFLVAIHNTLLKKGRELRLFGLLPAVVKAFHTTNLNKLLIIFATEQEALLSESTPPPK